jgi:hypothetical protein
VLDVIVPPGDYQLTLHNYDGDLNKCGGFSLKGLLNQKSAMMEDNAVDVRGFLQGATQCEIRSDPPPAMIY